MIYNADEGDPSYFRVTLVCLYMMLSFLFLPIDCLAYSPDVAVYLKCL